jgi:4'-phosphopantetheinyl transferase
VRVPDDDLVIWLCPLGLPATKVAAYVALLSKSERERAARFGTSALRHRYVAGRGTLRVILGQELGVAPDCVPIGRGPGGRPALLAGRRLDFNVTHTRDVALIALLRDSPAAARIGVDIEHENRDVSTDRLARRYLTAREREGLAGLDAEARRKRFIRLWTAKEAMSKATGDGLRAPMGRLDVDLAGMPRLVAGPPPYSPTAWRLIDVPLAGGFVATAARWNGLSAT